MRVVTVKRSMCDCGFPTLAEHIELGTEYDIDPKRVRDDLAYICGGCGKTVGGRHVWVASRGGRAGYLPLGLFSEPGPSQSATVQPD